MAFNRVRQHCRRLFFASNCLRQRLNKAPFLLPTSLILGKAALLIHRSALKVTTCCRPTPNLVTGRYSFTAIKITVATSSVYRCPFFLFKLFFSVTGSIHFSRTENICTVGACCHVSECVCVSGVGGGGR